MVEVCAACGGEDVSVCVPPPKPGRDAKEVGQYKLCRDCAGELLSVFDGFLREGFNRNLRFIIEKVKQEAFIAQ